MKASPLRLIASLCLLAVAGGVVGLIASAMSKEGASARDFIQYWAAGQELVHGANPYDWATSLEYERKAGFVGDTPFVTRNPPVAFFLDLPFGFVNPRTGMVLWLLLLLASLMVSVRMLWILNGRPENRLHLLSYVFAPVLACVMAGQVGILLLLGVTLFLYFHASKPYLAGAGLLLCSIKPHLFVPFGIVLLVWSLSKREYRILAGACAAVAASCALSFFVDRQAWSQYLQHIRTAGIQDEFVPTMSIVFRLLVDRNAVWLQSVPQAIACVWAIWYFWSRRESWSWMEQGLLVLLVSEACAPYAWFTDEVMLLPAILAAIYLTDRAGRSLLSYGMIAGIALVEILTQVQITSAFYLWTAPAWLGWYLYATRSGGAAANESRRDAAAQIG
jgi:hypothetical protein